MTEPQAKCQEYNQTLGTQRIYSLSDFLVWVVILLKAGGIKDWKLDYTTLCDICINLADRLLCHRLCYGIKLDSFMTDNEGVTFL